MRSISAPRTLRIDGAMYVRIDRGDLDLVLLKILNLMSRDARGPQSLEKIVQQYQQSHPDLSSEAIQARLTGLQLAGLVARHARGPGGQLGGSTTFEAYSLTGKGHGFVGASTSVAAMMSTKRGAGLLLVTTRHVLLLKRSATVGHPGTWGLAGGQLNPEEDPWSGALREVREEIGRVPRPLTVRHHYVRHLDHHHFDVYVVRVPSSVRATWQPRLNSEHTDWRWFRSDRLPLKLHPVVSWLTQTHQAWRQ